MATKRDDGNIVLDPKFAWCRGITGHCWERPKSLAINGKGLIELELSCLNCPTVRVDEIDASTGLMERRQYKYPKDYIVPNVGRPKAGAMRKAAIDALTGAGRVKKVA